jgi:hypothetical protein
MGVQREVPDKILGNSNGTKKSLDLGKRLTWYPLADVGDSCFIR